MWVGGRRKWNVIGEGGVVEAGKGREIYKTKKMRQYMMKDETAPTRHRVITEPAGRSKRIATTKEEDNVLQAVSFTQQ